MSEDTVKGFDPERPFSFVEQPKVKGTVAVPLVHGPVLANTPLHDVFCKSMRLLWAAMLAARGIPKHANATSDAVIQLTAVSGALAFAEAQAMLSLVTTGSAAAARIHLRAIGEAALRIRMFHKDPELALEVFRSYVVSQSKLTEKLLPADHKLRLQFKVLAEQASAQETDRKLTRELWATASGSADMLGEEAEAWSKWSHAEITALAEIARRASQNPDLPLGVALMDDGQGPYYFFRGALFLWSLLVSFVGIGVENEETVSELFQEISALGVDHGWAVPGRTPLQEATSRR